MVTTRTILVAVVMIASYVDSERIEVRSSGVIRSSELSPRITYHYIFPEHPSDGTLLVFNITKINNLTSGDLQFYSDDAPSYTRCDVYIAKNSNACLDIWRRKFGNCLHNALPTQRVGQDRKGITINKIGGKKRLVIEYKIVHCNTGEMFPFEKITRNAVFSNPAATDQTTTVTDEGSVPKNTKDVDWPLILAVAMSSVAIVLIIVFAIIKCRKRMLRKAPEKPENEGGYEQPRLANYEPPRNSSNYEQPRNLSNYEQPRVVREPIYEEIQDYTETYDDLSRARATTEPPIRRFEFSGHDVNSGYDGFDRREKSLTTAPLPLATSSNTEQNI